MFRNLEAELARSGMTKQRLASEIGCTPSTLSLKLCGRSPITLSEAAKIKRAIGVTVPLEELFKETIIASDSA